METLSSVIEPLTALIHLSAEAQMSELGTLQKRTSCATEYLKEFCTVLCRTSRGSGHSTAIIQVASKMEESFILLSTNQYMADKLYEKGVALHGTNFKDKVVYSGSVEHFLKNDLLQSQLLLA